MMSLSHVGEIVCLSLGMYILEGLPIFGKFYDEFIPCVEKLFVSLWDLFILRGLLIFIKFYDESIPCAAELIG